MRIVDQNTDISKLQFKSGTRYVIFVHGFNATPERAVRAYWKMWDLIFRELPAGSQIEPIGFLWPSVGRIGPLAYWRDYRTAIRQNPRLQELIVKIFNNTDSDPVVIAHSMGTVVANDTDSNCIIHLAGDLRISKACKYLPSHKIHNYYSRFDPVVGWISRLLRPGKRIGTFPLPFANENIDATLLTGRRIRHNDYKRSVEVARSIAAKIS